MRDAHLQAEAAVVLAQAVASGPLAFTDRAAPALERALEALGDEQSSLRARALAQLSFADISAPRERRLDYAHEASDLARKLGDRAALAEALSAVHWSLTQWGPERVEDRLAACTEWVDVAGQIGDARNIVSARVFRATALAELGDMVEARAELKRAWEQGDGLREPFFAGYGDLWGGVLASMEGRYSDAEAQAVRAVQTSQRSQHPGYIASVLALFYAIRLAQGRLAELEQPVIQSLTADPDGPNAPVQRAALAYLYMETDRPAEAREWFERLAANDFADMPRDLSFLTVIVLATTMARRMSDERRAATLYEILEPYATRNIVTGPVVGISGSASNYLGVLAAATRRWDDAERHFEYALVFNKKISSPPWLARTQFEYAAMLEERDAPGDRARAQELVSSAMTTYEQLGMKKDLERAFALKLELQGVSSGDIYTSIDSVARAVERERPVVSIHPAPDGTVTIMFSDIEDSTVLTERLGDQAWQDLLRKHNALIREQLQAHGGYEVKTMGDGFMVAFQSAKKGLDCAIAIQRAFDGHNAAAGEHVKVRIGLHAGEAIKDGDDFYGKNVILASRVAGKAVGGEILVSSLLRQLVESSVGAAMFGEPRDVELKGLAGTHVVYAVAST